MKFKFYLLLLFYLSSYSVSNSQNLTARNNTFVMLTIGAPKSVPRHVMLQNFLLNEGDSISVKADSLSCFLSSIYQQSKRVPVGSFGFPHSVYFQLWGRNELIYQASQEFLWMFDEKLNKLKSTIHFTLNDGTPISAEYIDISGIYYVDEDKHACSVEFEIPDEECIKEAWSIVAVIACKKSQQIPIRLDTIK